MSPHYTDNVLTFSSSTSLMSMVVSHWRNVIIIYHSAHYRHQCETAGRETKLTSVTYGGDVILLELKLIILSHRNVDVPLEISVCRPLRSKCYVANHSKQRTAEAPGTRCVQTQWSYQQKYYKPINMGQHF